MARSAPSPAPDPGLYCADYREHQLHHRRAFAGGPYICEVCEPTRPGAPSFREAMARGGFTPPHEEKRP